MVQIPFHQRRIIAMRTGHATAEQVVVQAGRLALEGDLAIPERALGIVVFAHGSGSSRRSPRNREVAEMLNDYGLATLLFDLLTTEEEAIDVRTREYRFDIPRLGERMTGAVDWVADHDTTATLPIGLFGASTGAAAALIAAASRPQKVRAVVSRGGRPDLADDALPRVQAPTLLIGGGGDQPVIGMNEGAQAQMRAETRLVIVPGATHLFEEPGKLEEVARLTADWFREKFKAPQRVVPA
jgi:putative phosphoribosyl transferase